MRFLVNDEEVAPADVTYSELNFGRVGGSYPVCRYRMEIPVDEFLERFGRTYEEAVAELRRDDEMAGEFHPPYPGVTDYPSLPELMSVGGDAFHDFADAHLKFDVYGQYFSELTKRPRFALATADRISTDERVVSIEGRARKRSG